MLSQFRRFQLPALIATGFLAFSTGASSQEGLPKMLLALPKWTPGEKATFQVQQVVKERNGTNEETRFLANGSLEISAVETHADSVTFLWHRRMDNAELELVREPWGIRGNPASEKLILNLIRDGLPVNVRLNLRTQRAYISNREELTQAIRRNLQSVGGDFAGNVTGRYRTQSPGEQSNREPTKAQLGIYQGIARQDNTKVALTPRAAGAVAAWYGRLVQSEIEDFLGALGREFVNEAQAASSPSAAQTYRPAGVNEVLLTLTNSSKRLLTSEVPQTEEAKEGEPAQVGLSGGLALPSIYEAKIELSIPSGWPKRAAIVRMEAENDSQNSKRTTLRRVYLRQTP